MEALEERETEYNLLIILDRKVAMNTYTGVGVFLAGWFVKYLTVKCLVWINLSTETN